MGDEKESALKYDGKICWKQPLGNGYECVKLIGIAQNYVQQWV